MTRAALEASPDVAMTADGAARLLAACLTEQPLPLVAILQATTGQAILRLEVTDDGEHDLTPGELDALDVPAGTTARWRTGFLVTENQEAAADTVLTWIPDRIPPAAQPDMDAGRRPAGHILGSHGVTRHRRRAVAVGPQVHSQAVLYLGYLPVAIAEEYVTARMCELMAATPHRWLPGYAPE